MGLPPPSQRVDRLLGVGISSPDCFCWLVNERRESPVVI